MGTLHSTLKAPWNSRSPTEQGCIRDTLIDHTRDDHCPWTPGRLGQHTSQSKFTEMGHLAKWTSGEWLTVNPRPATLVSSPKSSRPLCRPLPADLSAPLRAAELADRPGPGARPARGLAAPGSRAYTQSQPAEEAGSRVAPHSGGWAGLWAGRDAAVSSAPPCAPGFQTPAPWSCSSRLFSSSLGDGASFPDSSVAFLGG